MLLVFERIRFKGASRRKITLRSAPHVTSVASDPSPAMRAPVTAASWSSIVSSRRYVPKDPSGSRDAS